MLLRFLNSVLFLKRPTWKVHLVSLNFYPGVLDGFDKIKKHLRRLVSEKTFCLRKYLKKLEDIRYNREIL
jgi:hypothetical protein